MRIDPTSTPGRSAALRRRRHEHGFALPDESPSADAVDLAAPAVAASAISAGDSAPTAEEAARSDLAAARHGEEMLDALAGFQTAALSGDGAAAADILSSLTAVPSRASDPRLDAVLQGIAARAAVELARRG